MTTAPKKAMELATDNSQNVDPADVPPDIPHTCTDTVDHSVSSTQSHAGNDLPEVDVITTTHSVSDQSEVTTPELSLGKVTPLSQCHCILHTDAGKSKANEPIIKITDSNWTVIQKTAAARTVMTNFSKSKYYNVISFLPQTFNDTHGYHAGCYKNFTAVSKSSVNAQCGNVTPQNKQLRSALVSPTANSTGVLQNICIFCNQLQKKTRQKNEYPGACQTIEGERAIKDAASILKDQCFLTKFQDIDFVAKEVKYHHSCRASYLSSAARETNRQPTNATATITVNTSLHGIVKYVETSVLINKRSELLTSVHAQYLEMCEDSGEKALSSAQYLMKYLLHRFDGRLKATSTNAKKLGIILYCSTITDESIHTAYDYTHSDEGAARKIALSLRKIIKSAPSTSFSDDLTLTDLLTGEGNPPQELQTFFRTLYGGPNENHHSDRVKRQADSSSQDAFFIVGKGKVKPKKHIALGIAVKSMTGSKKLVTILNRLGHCINYHSTEEIETAVGETIKEKKSTCPEGTAKNQYVGLAFDNYDEFVGTLSGADSLHDTMGILYHSEVAPDEIQEVTKSVDTSSQIKRPWSRKRKLDYDDQTLMPYRKVPKMTEFKYANTAVWDMPDVSHDARKADMSWMIRHSFSVPNTPMWVGYNSLTNTNKHPKQVVRYMQNMQHPITSLDVIQETLQITQNCSRECSQKYGLVTYDLNAAKSAIQIQCTESPKYDDVFIMLGAFHIELAFFKGLGKVIVESGGPKMLTDTGVLAPGSLNGFMSGKNFNRCKRLHPILALAFEILHFQSFLDVYGDKYEIVDLIGKTETEKYTWEEVEKSEVYKHVIDAYQSYVKTTKSGEHGATAQFWLMYVEYVQLYHTLERAIRTNDVDLFIAALTPIIALFFATNHPNYSRWLAKYQLDLMNLNSTHPGLKDILEQGMFTIIRTDHSFSRIPVDLTLEQTINADAASRLTGISAATNNYSARLRWMLTKTTRAAVLGELQEMVGLSRKEDVTAELKSSRVSRDRVALEKVMCQIKKTSNPFENTPTRTLFNISTGKITSTATQKCLLTIPARGRKRHQEFVEKCNKDGGEFQKPITREKLTTFKNECATNRRTTNKTVAILKCSRDLPGRLCILATIRKLNLIFIFSFPLTPVPLCLCEPDGTMSKTDKHPLFSKLEKKTESAIPDRVDACVIDGNFLLHTLPSHLPPSYAGVARTILMKCVSFSSTRIDVVFDTYFEPSIKDCERNRRASDGNEQVYVITGPEQTRPRKFAEALRYSSFKKQLPGFLAVEWGKAEYAHIIQQRDVYLAHDNKCSHFYVRDGVTVIEDIVSLHNNHEEADTMVCLHIAHINRHDDLDRSCNVVVRASDTDIAIILLHHSEKFASTLWMDVGTTSQNNRRYVNISDIARSLGPSMCAALPGFHAFTGSDYTSSFVRKGKVRPLEKLEKNHQAQVAFHNLTVEDPLENSTIVTLEQFTCSLYGAKPLKDGVHDLDLHRHQMFQDTYGPKSTQKDPLEKLKGIDGSAFAPCKRELMEHINRTAFVAKMWAKCDQPVIYHEPLEEDGWELIDNKYRCIWFQGPQVPGSLVPEDGDDVPELINEDDDDDNDAYYVSTDDEDGNTSSDED